jgi:virginiamycin B lyase
MKKILTTLATAALLAPAAAEAQISTYSIPSHPVIGGQTRTVSSPSGITRGPDGNVWFTCENGAVIGNITPAHAITLYAVAPATSHLGGITTGSDGNIWFTDFTDQRVERITPTGTNLTLYQSPARPAWVGSRPGRTGTSGSPKRSRARSARS